MLAVGRSMRQGSSPSSRRSTSPTRKSEPATHTTGVRAGPSAISTASAADDATPTSVRSLDWT